VAANTRGTMRIAVHQLLHRVLWGRRYGSRRRGASGTLVGTHLDAWMHAVIAPLVSAFAFLASHMANTGIE
jgi:hypothetical protein